MNIEPDDIEHISLEARYEYLFWNEDNRPDDVEKSMRILSNPGRCPECGCRVNNEYDGFHTPWCKIGKY